jgi:hypothetical protein
VSVSIIKLASAAFLDISRETYRKSHINLTVAISLRFRGVVGSKVVFFRRKNVIMSLA